MFILQIIILKNHYQNRAVRHDHRRRRGLALHGRGREDQLHEWIAALDDVADVLPHRAHRRGHYADPAGPARQRPLAVRIEEALRRQAGPQLLVSGVQIAGARRRQ